MKKNILLFLGLLLTVGLNAQLNKLDVEMYFNSVPKEEWGPLRITTQVPTHFRTESKYGYDFMDIDQGTFTVAFGDRALTVTYMIDGKTGSKLIPYDKIRSIGFRSVNNMITINLLD